MGKCDEAKNRGVEKISKGFDVLIEGAALNIAELKKRKLNPEKHYDTSLKKDFNWVKYLEDLGSEKAKAILDFINYIQNECYEAHEAVLQVATDKAIVYYTNGLSEVLPKHFTHIDVRKILEGKPLGGDNSIFNEVKREVYKVVGWGENNDLRKTFDDPVDTAKKVTNDIFKAAGIPIRL